MHETEEQIEALQALIDRSFENAGAHTLSIIRPERRLNARQLVKYLEGMKHIVVGTVTSKGEPRVSPVDGHFLRGRFYFGTDGRSVRARHLRRRRAVSLTRFEGDRMSIVVHGQADEPVGRRLAPNWKTVGRDCRRRGVPILDRRAT